MSVRVMSLVWDSPEFSGTTKLVMLCLADYANDEGLCWPSVGSLEKKCSVARSTIKAQLKKLVETGFISVQRRKKTTEDGLLTNDNNLYQIDIQTVKNTIPTEAENEPRPKSDLGRLSEGGRAGADPKPSIDPSVDQEPPVVPQTEKPVSKKNNRKTQLPEGFSVTPEMHDWYAAQTFTLSVEDATVQWCDAMLAGGYMNIDWLAAWRNGMRKQNEWAQQRGGNAPQRRSVNQVSGRDADYGPGEKWR